ncbi:PPE family protein [Mycobacterium ostraviense]|uniref:PPE family protein n=1 Tax=Mycobacterium ostraviense TaxID=2738409 RepID=UPI0038CBF491
MLAASAAWDGVAAELGSAATSFEALTAQLAGGTWLGAASAAMLGAAAPYAAWLHATASDAEQAAAQARSAVSAFEAAQPATVHPAIIAGNRSQLLSLVMSNLFGQNAPAIPLAEAEYEQMWAQDVTAMLGYHLSARQLSRSYRHGRNCRNDWRTWRIARSPVGNFRTSTRAVETPAASTSATTTPATSTSATETWQLQRGF